MFGSNDSPLFGSGQMGQFKPDYQDIIPGIPVTAELFGLGDVKEDNSTQNLFFLGALGSVLLGVTTKDEEIKNVSLIIAAVLALAGIMKKQESPMAPKQVEPPQEAEPSAPIDPYDGPPQMIPYTV